MKPLSKQDLNLNALQGFLHPDDDSNGLSPYLSVFNSPIEVFAKVMGKELFMATQDLQVGFVSRQVLRLQAYLQREGRDRTRTYAICYFRPPLPTAPTITDSTKEGLVDPGAIAMTVDQFTVIGITPRASMAYTTELKYEIMNPNFKTNRIYVVLCKITDDEIINGKTILKSYVEVFDKETKDLMLIAQGTFQSLSGMEELVETTSKLCTEMNSDLSFYPQGAPYVVLTHSFPVKDLVLPTNLEEIFLPPHLSQFEFHSGGSMHGKFFRNDSKTLFTNYIYFSPDAHGHPGRVHGGIACSSIATSAEFAAQEISDVDKTYSIKSYFVKFLRPVPTNKISRVILQRKNFHEFHGGIYALNEDKLLLSVIVTVTLSNQSKF